MVSRVFFLLCASSRYYDFYGAPKKIKVNLYNGLKMCTRKGPY